MKTSVKASLQFYFKGEAFAPSVTIDLDAFFASGKATESCYADLARSIGLDNYRHEYDVMCCEEIVYADATGIAVNYVHDGAMDWQGLEQAWRKQGDVRAVGNIANKYFNVENMEAHPKLAAALLSAYREGAAQQTLIKRAERNVWQS